jgi:hypothetical protein
MVEAGGTFAPAVKPNSKVVTSIEVFNPIRSPTAPISLRLNKKENVETIPKIIGGMKV